MALDAFYQCERTLERLRREPLGAFATGSATG